MHQAGSTLTLIALMGLIPVFLANNKNRIFTGGSLAIKAGPLTNLNLEWGRPGQ